MEMNNSYSKDSEKEFVDFTDIKVRFSEIDSLDILWHGNYIKYFEDGREAFGEKYGLTHSNIREHGYFAPVTKLELEYKNYVKHGTLLELETTFHFIRSAKIIFSYNIRKKNSQETVCVGKSEQVFVNAQTFQLAFSKPLFYRKWETKFLTINK